MASRLPTIPRIIFTVIEPITLLMGAIPALFSPAWFISEQITSPGVLSRLVSPGESALLVAQQLGNAYLLLFMIGVAVLYSTSEVKVVRNYLAALLVADAGHVAVTYFGLGHERFVDVGRWNSMTAGNVGFTAVLACFRILYLSGAFGPDSPSLGSSKKTQ